METDREVVTPAKVTGQTQSQEPEPEELSRKGKCSSHHPEASVQEAILPPGVWQETRGHAPQPLEGLRHWPAGLFRPCLLLTFQACSGSAVLWNTLSEHLGNGCVAASISTLKS